MSPLPQTILQLSGAPLHPAPLDRAALVLIDHQREYVDGALPLSGMAAAVDAAANLLALARRHGVPVFHVLHHGKPGGAAFDPTGPGVAVIDALAPLPEEATVIKSLPNSFAGTDLHARLHATGRPELIIAGFMTHGCVSATARAAIDLGYRVTLVAAACATRDLPHADGGGVLSAADLHRATLAALADRVAVVVPDAGVWK